MWALHSWLLPEWVIWQREWQRERLRERRAVLCSSPPMHLSTPMQLATGRTLTLLPYFSSAYIPWSLIPSFLPPWRLSSRFSPSRCILHVVAERGNWGTNHPVTDPPALSMTPANQVHGSQGLPAPVASKYMVFLISCPLLSLPSVFLQLWSSMSPSQVNFPDLQIPWLHASGMFRLLAGSFVAVHRLSSYVAWAQQLQCRLHCSVACGSLVPLTRDWTHVPCIARWILNHGLPRKSPSLQSLINVRIFLSLAPGLRPLRSHLSICLWTNAHSAPRPPTGSITVQGNIFFRHTLASNQYRNITYFHHQSCGKWSLFQNETLRLGVHNSHPWLSYHYAGQPHFNLPRMIRQLSPPFYWWGEWDCSFPGGSYGKESVCNAGAPGDAVSIPGSGRSPEGGNGNPLQDSWLENPIDRGA